MKSFTYNIPLANYPKLKEAIVKEIPFDMKAFDFSKGVISLPIKTESALISLNVLGREVSVNTKQEAIDLINSLFPEAIP